MPAQSAAASFNPSRMIMAQVIESALIHRTASKAEATAKAVELTLGWSARELSESLFETLIGSFNPSERSA